MYMYLELRTLCSLHSFLSQYPYAHCKERWVCGITFDLMIDFSHVRPRLYM